MLLNVKIHTIENLCASKLKVFTFELKTLDELLKVDIYRPENDIAGVAKAALSIHFIGTDTTVNGAFAFWGSKSPNRTRPGVVSNRTII